MKNESKNELNLNGIHLNMKDLLKKYNSKIGSCSDAEEIQQISLFCQQNRNYYLKQVLIDMINPMYSYCGLYPEIMKTFNIKPDKLK